MEMKELTFTFEGSKYTLAFNRKTVQMLSRSGFRTDMISDQPAIGIPMLFRGAFMVHHRMIKEDLTDRIWKAVPDKDKFLSKLVEMYLEPINDLLADPEEDDEAKKIEWGANF